MARRHFLAVVLLAAALHAHGIARSILPAQDGLKFIKVARQFQTQPVADVVRSTDRHPLYPATIALVQPAVAIFGAQGPDGWRITAQLVSALASLALLFPLYWLTCSLFDARTAALTVLLLVLLPSFAEVGHDTLSDALALAATVFALGLGERCLRLRSSGAGVACGLVAGLGFLARPEVLVVPAAVVGTAGLRLCLAARRAETAPDADGLKPHGGVLSALKAPLALRASAVAVSFLVVVGSYAMVKGQVSEKLALRWGAALPAQPIPVRKAPQWLPRGLDDPRWDFSAKEESDAPRPSGIARSFLRVFMLWAEGLGWVLAPLALWAVFRCRAVAGRMLLAAYAALFAAILVRHASTLGYLSGRHELALVIVSLPWAAAGALACWEWLARVRQWNDSRRRLAGVLALSALVVAGIVVQAKPPHPSRWGHWAAGRWLLAHSEPSDAVLDTRGWASFVSGGTSYDYWHVRQALTDAHLRYIVVGSDELAAPSRRAETLRAVLAYAAAPVASFSLRQGGRDAGVQVFRFQRPASWEGLRP